MIKIEGLGNKSLCRYLAEELTSKRDRDSLCHCLVALIGKLFSPESCTLYELKGTELVQPEAEQTLSSISLVNMLEPAQPLITLGELEGGSEAVRSGLAVKTGLTGNRKRLIQPVRGFLGVYLLIVLDGCAYSDKMEAIVDDLAAIFGNLNLLLMQSERDALTGLLNRQAFDRRMAQTHTDLENVYRREKDHGGDSFFVMLDIDYFKRINDNFGHLHGDEVLLTFARLMDSTFRHSDYLFRYGGEEFAVILTNVSAHDAGAILERFREKVMAYIFPLVGEVTVSLGVTEIKACVPVSSIIEQADRALYYAKEHGRNRVDSYEKLVSTGELQSIDIPAVDVELF